VRDKAALTLRTRGTWSARLRSGALTRLPLVTPWLTLVTLVIRSKVRVLPSWLHGEYLPLDPAA
jgi:hypothetical protein